MSVIPCTKNLALRSKIEEYADVLKAEAHTLGTHGLGKGEFYASGLFRGAIERIRGQFAATMSEKREFVRNVLDHLVAQSHIVEWESAGESNRHDYTVGLRSGHTAVIELKGCLDGNNTTIYERPAHAEEFVIWSVCTNASADPRHNVWSGIHTRLSADIIERKQQVDGLIVWDAMCGSVGRPCPKVLHGRGPGGGPGRLTQVGDLWLPPPCLYVFAATVPSPRNNPHPPVQKLDGIELLHAFHQCFMGHDDEVNYVDIAVAHQGSDTVRTTTVRRGGNVQKASLPTAIRRK